jgi:hypothetical protein
VTARKQSATTSNPRPEAAAPRTIVGNLDFEEDLARRAGARPAPLSPAARATVSALATLLRAFAEEGDRIWTLVPVDPDRMAEVDGLPRPALVAGPLPADDAAVYWGRPSRTAARVCHRGFALGISRDLGADLPGASLVADVDDLERRATGVDRWVLKAPLCAAGRSRLRSEGWSRRRAERFLAMHGPSLFEPWMERLEDFGCAGTVDDEVRLLEAHRQALTPRGRFRGIELCEVPEPERSRIGAAALEAGRRLREAGYRGPFGTDAWSYRDCAGRPALNPLGELNARTTFGHVARQLAERVAPGAGRASLRIGRGDPPPGGLPLLLPGEPDGTSAWLDILGSGGENR